jgi:hypothetical protein
VAIGVDISATIRRLANELESSSYSADERQAAQRTGGVPVYADLGGVLSVTPDIRVLRFDPEQDSVDVVNDQH